MFGDIKAINAWAKSEAIRKRALATNGVAVEPPKKTCTSGACRRTAPLKEAK